MLLLISSAPWSSAEALLHACILLYHFLDSTPNNSLQKIQFALNDIKKNVHAGNEDEIYCEMVKGLGESLVSGMVPGSALSFVAQKTDLHNPEVKTFPSKSNGMFVPESLIFRSDSNGEDLAGYAGAGLYESITMDPSTLDIVDFSADPIMQDLKFRCAPHILFF